MRAWVAAPVAALLLVSGCAATTTVPPGPTEAEVDALVSQQLDEQWILLDLPRSVAKPQVTRVAFTSPSTWSYRQLGCYLSSRLDARDSSGDITVNGLQPGVQSASPYAVQLAVWTCQAQYPRDPRLTGYLSDAQVLYMYDYFSTRLAPCLRLLGYAVPTPPARADYLASVRSGGAWDPYYSADGTAIVQAPSDVERLNLQCPPLPDDPFWAYRPLGWLHS